LYRDAVNLPPPNHWQLVLPALTQPAYAWRLVRKRLGLPLALETEDRRVLEQVILAAYREDKSRRRVLFVGCDFYTAHYARRYFADREYWTLEPDPARRRFGASRHVIAAFEQLSHHFPRRYFDLIICNGVFGWGLDQREQCEVSFGQACDCLVPGGELMLGWNDLPQRTPVPLDEIASLRRFERATFAPLGTWRYLTSTPYRHTFDFYRRPLLAD
jgi:SAM-dependent methyltransferase